MKKLIFFAFLSFLMIFKTFSQDQLWRPDIHVTAPKNWINDPNGLIYFKGEYHVFYQHNPIENKWGHMSWGHSKSKDLIQWENLPLAIPEGDKEWIFSGCVVYDSLNTSGLGIKGNGPLVAVYTADYHGAYENQHLAFSNDGGLTWTKYDKNPIIPFPLAAGQNTKSAKDFRDPNILWHQKSKQWVMAVAKPTEYAVHFYGSKNLKDWKFLSVFEKNGDTSKIWECPALVEVPVKGINGKNLDKKWVLLVSSPGYHEGFTGMQYFIGDFDGVRFENDYDALTKKYLDLGKDFYAAIPFYGSAQPMILGWMSSWNYAQKLPTESYKGQMSLPRNLELLLKGGEYYLNQQVAQQIKNSDRWSKTLIMNGMGLAPGNDLMGRTESDTYLIDLNFETPLSGRLELEILKSKDKKTRIILDFDQKEMLFDRSESGILVDDSWQNQDRIDLKFNPQSVDFQVWVDKSTLEIFVDGKSASYLVFPPADSKNWLIAAKGNPIKLRTFEVKELKR